MDPVSISGNRNNRSVVRRNNQTRRAAEVAAVSYIVVSDNKENDFTVKVMNKIREGYALQGGVSVVIGNNSYKLYTQAMVKY